MKILLNWFASESLSLSSILKYFSFQIIIVVDYIKSPLYNQPEHNKIHVKFMLNISSVFILLFVQIVLIILNAIFASAEIAVLSMNETKLERMAEQGNNRAKRLVRLTQSVQIIK